MRIFIVERGELSPVDKPVFSRGDTYVVDAGDKIWIWIGSKSTVDESSLQLSYQTCWIGRGEGSLK